MDGVHVSHQVPRKLAPRWFGPYVLEVKWFVCSLGLPESMGKTFGLNVRCLKFFKERDAAFWECQGRYCHLQSVAFLKAYGASWHPCVHRHNLFEHVPSMLMIHECHTHGIPCSHMGCPWKFIDTVQLEVDYSVAIFWNFVLFHQCHQFILSLPERQHIGFSDIYRFNKKQKMKSPTLHEAERRQ